VRDAGEAVGIARPEGAGGRLLNRPHGTATATTQ
jgi:hypothetical protein